jgi:hypothetical protein
MVKVHEVLQRPKPTELLKKTQFDSIKIYLKKDNFRAGGVAQVVEYLPSKCEVINTHLYTFLCIISKMFILN